MHTLYFDCVFGGGGGEVKVGELPPGIHSVEGVL